MRFIVHCADDEVLPLNIGPGENLVTAANRQGVSLPVDCLEGVCGTCKLRLVDGRVEEKFHSDDALSSEEVAAGYVLACQSAAQSDLVVMTAALSSQLRLVKSRNYFATVTSIEAVAKDTVHLKLRLDDADAFDFLPGQYAKIKIPGTGSWRSFSFTTAPGRRELGFLIRVLPHGAMSDYLRSAKAGDVLTLTGPHGVFFLRPNAGESVMVAGGTGLGPMLSMAQTLAEQAGETPPMTLLYGVNYPGEVACRDILDGLVDSLANFSYAVTVAGAGECRPFRHGLVTDLLDRLEAGKKAAATFYLCGPPPMIEAARNKLKSMGVDEARIVFEKFLPAAAP